jgi:hypothetical protein
MSNITESILLTGQEARELLGGVSRATMVRWAKSWGLRKVGHKYLREDLERAVREYAKPAGEAA